MPQHTPAAKRGAPLHTPPVPPSQAGMRLDKWLAAALPELSRSRLQALIAEGMVAIDGAAVCDASRRLRAGEAASVRIPPAAEPTPAPEAIALSVVYEDDQIIVVDKPAGMVVHPAPGSPSATLVNALLHHCAGSLSGIGGVKRPGIVHRIDKDTSGLLVVAKTDAAHRHLAAQFAHHSIVRAYRALCWGVPTPAQGEIRGNVGRSPADRKKMAVLRHGGKSALTRYRVLRAFGTTAALVECRLETGRTHQVRVHMAEIGHPLVGDPVYGRRRGRSRGAGAAKTEPAGAALAAFPRQALHACELGFIHPSQGTEMHFFSDMPIDIKRLISELELI